MDGPFDANDDATALRPEERDELIPTHLALRGELSELEQKNIAEADWWAFSRKRNVLGETFLRSLHRRMFNRSGNGPEITGRQSETSASKVIVFSRSYGKSSTTRVTGLSMKATHRMNWLYAFITV